MVRLRNFRKRCLRRVMAPALSLLTALSPLGGATALADHDRGHDGHRTATPIQHLIVIIGENHTFDNVFATYQPKSGDGIWNLLSEGIVKPDGSAGPNYGKAVQQQADDTSPSKYSIAPAKTGPYANLPQPNTTYALGLPLNVPDTRFPNPMPNGPHQITKWVPYQLAFTGDPPHRFFQMWQQFDEGALDLFAWVDLTVGIGPQNSPPAPTPGNTLQGSEAMGFFNMASGDAPVFKFIADNYAIADNYHQSIMGGTGANFIALGTADVAFFSDGFGHALPAFPLQVENPDPQPATNNFYTQDGYGGGSYVNCADTSQPGVKAITDYLATLPGSPSSNCEPGHYYLVNNYSPGFNPDGTTKPIDAAHTNLPPQTLPSIADSMSAAGVSWKYYIGGWNNGNPNAQWCSICNPFQFIRSVMTTGLRNNIQDVPQFYQDVAHGRLPAVSFIRPYESYAGHPADSSLSSYEDFVSSIANAVIANRELFESTAIVVTTDEGGGYYDSGYIQTLDFFGDGTRIPLLVISPWVRAGHIDHTYYDHTSIIKFIEANWGLSPLSGRSRDNLPNPVTGGDAYVPINAPAVGDLMELFDFPHRRSDHDTPFITAGGI